MATQVVRKTILQTKQQALCVAKDEQSKKINWRHFNMLLRTYAQQSGSKFNDSGIGGLGGITE